MTEEKALEFAKLQLVYLTKVGEEDTTEQARLLEILFFWIEKQIVLRILDDAKAVGMIEAPPLPKLSQHQREEFGALQAALLQAFGELDKSAANWVEKQMRDWIDGEGERAAQRATAGFLKPKFKIVKGE
jgi:hypothetical protein